MTIEFATRVRSAKGSGAMATPTAMATTIAATTSRLIVFRTPIFSR